MSQVLSKEVESQAQTALSSSPIYALRDVHVECDGDRMLLSGRVNSFYQKQLAQEVVRPFVDEYDLINTIDVE